MKRIEREEWLQRRLEVDLDMYKFYIELAVKVSAFFFTLAGGILAYTLANHQENRIVLAALALPILISVTLCAIYTKAIKLGRWFEQDHYKISEDLGIEAPYDVSLFPILLQFFAWIYGVVGLALVALLAWMLW